MPDTPTTKKSTLSQRDILRHAVDYNMSAAVVMEELGRGQAHVAMVREAAIHLRELHRDLTKVAQADEAEATRRAAQ